MTPERIMNTRMRMRKVVRYRRSSGLIFALQSKKLEREVSLGAIEHFEHKEHAPYVAKSAHIE